MVSGRLLTYKKVSGLGPFKEGEKKDNAPRPDTFFSNLSTPLSQ